MNDFLTYFNLGFKHITDLGGYDHILFIVALCAVYLISDWKQLLIIVTFFTIGHSITLALAVLKLVNIDSKIIEFLIPVTILFTALSNLFQNLPENISMRSGAAQPLPARGALPRHDPAVRRRLPR